MDWEMGKIFRLKGKIQHYEWGGNGFIPSLLNIENESQQPFAEYWMGAHAKSSSAVEMDHHKIALNELIQKYPSILGEDVQKRFHSFPYLLKVLDVKNMLSIQVHPDKKAAEIGFEKENQKSIPINAANRNYKDDNHKPELMVALSDFWLLHGFKTENKLSNTLKKNHELNSLLTIFKNTGYRGLYEEVMEMPQQKVNDLLSPLLDKYISLYMDHKLKKDSEGFWAARAALTFNQHKKIDRGIFSIFFFNLLHLKKTDGIFQAAGIPHAYLEGQNVEIMANSDNVLRAGLTTKHIDVSELIKLVKFEGIEPFIIKPVVNELNEYIYQTPALDFQLSYFQLNENENAKFISRTAEIIFIMKGELQIIHTSGSIHLMKGESVLVITGQYINFHALEKSEVYRASVPVHNEK